MPLAWEQAASDCVRYVTTITKTLIKNTAIILISPENIRTRLFLTVNKHMMKRGAPPDKVGVLHRLLPIEFHGFTGRIDSKGYHSLVPGLISFFSEMLWVTLT